MNDEGDTVRLPRWKSQGTPELSDALNTLAGSIERAFSQFRLEAGSGVNVVRSEQGQVVSVKKNISQVGKGAQQPPCAWDMIIRDDPNDAENTALVKVWPGLLGGSVLGNHTEEKSVSKGAGTLKFVYLDVTTANGGVSSVEWNWQNTAPDGIEVNKDFPPTSFKLVIGIIEGRTDSNQNKSVLPFKTVACSIGIKPIESIREPKTSPPVGELPYKIFYTWEVS